MTKRRNFRLFVLAALTLALSASAAQAQRFTKIDGNRLLAICTSTNAGVRQTCESYIDGVSDTITLYQQIGPASQGTMKVPMAICVPAETSGAQLAAAVVAWLRGHAADRSRPAGAIVYRVLRERYACR